MGGISAMKELTNNLYHLNLQKANVYLFKSKQGLVLIDTSVVGSLKILEPHLKRAGFQLQDISHILITHAHIDHVGGLAEIQAATKAEVWVHEIDAPFVRAGKPPPYTEFSSLSLQDKLIGNFIMMFVGKEQPAAPVQRELKSGERLDELWEGLGLVHLPGHSPGHSGFYFSKERVLVGGDVMMHLTPWLTRPVAAFTEDVKQADESILKVASMKVATLAVGHGEPFVGNAANAIQKLTAKIEQRR
jgi:glyoxylase-like metal-dependent hydrolase (beta-lactamase superfamily II)